MQQAWLKKRLDTFLPALMRKHGIDLWVVPMREVQRGSGVLVDYRARDVRRAAAHDLRVLRQVRRRRRAGRARPASNASRSAARRRAACSRRRTVREAPSAAAGRRRARPSSGATSSGTLLKEVIEERKPKVIGIDRSKIVRVHRRALERRAAGDDARRSGARGRRGSATPKRCRST